MWILRGKTVVSPHIVRYPVKIVFEMCKIESRLFSHHKLPFAIKSYDYC